MDWTPRENLNSFNNTFKLIKLGRMEDLEKLKEQ